MAAASYHPVRCPIPQATKRDRHGRTHRSSVLGCGIAPLEFCFPGDITRLVHVSLAHAVKFFSRRPNPAIRLQRKDLYSRACIAFRAPVNLTQYVSLA
jgi:hypothetical protein